MEINQIYGIVNSVVSQGLGSNDLTVVDEKGLIALGNTILSSSVNTENFLNTLVQRIGRTIISTRKYQSKFSDMVLDNMQFGAIVQKLKIDMPSAEQDESFDLVNNGSVDMYKINKPNVHQKLFVSETPWQMHITIQRVHLKEAFTSESAMGSFISAVFTEVENKIELAMENLGRNCLANYIAEVSDKPTRAFNLLDMYNSETNESLTVNTAKNSKEFLNFAIAKIKSISKRLTDMSTLYNDGSVTRHSPKDLQKLYLLTDWVEKMETVTQYQAFHKDLVSLDGYKELTYIQSQKTPDSIKVNRSSDEEEITVNNIMAVICDRDAFGIYKKEEWTSTTPFNSAGGYANTYWHFKDLYFNDLSENFVLFYLAEV